MAWTIKVSEIAQKQLKKMDKSVTRKITSYLREKVAAQKNPKLLSKPLLHDKSGLWRFRIENYRIICEIQDNELLVLVLTVGHKKEVYK